MAFTVNHSEVNDYQIKPKGEYECIIERVKPSTTKLGKPCINLVLIIRNDVQNPVKGGKIFDALYKKTQPSAADLNVDGFSAAQIQRWCKAARIENGRHFDSLEDLCAALEGKLVRVTLDHEEYKGKPHERIGFANETRFPECKHKFKEKANLNAEFTELPADDGDDVPF